MGDSRPFAKRLINCLFALHGLRSWLPDLTTTAAYCGRCRFTTSIAADLRRYARGHGHDGLAKAMLPWNLTWNRYPVEVNLEPLFPRKEITHPAAVFDDVALTRKPHLFKLLGKAIKVQATNFGHRRRCTGHIAIEAEFEPSAIKLGFIDSKSITPILSRP
nr:hypothetical protein [Xanthomonas phaseoli]